MKFIYATSEESFLNKISPWIGSVLLLSAILYFSFNIGNYLFLDNLNLLIHEGGHGIFRIFGKFICALGGTLMQIIIPAMFVVYYFFKRIRFGTQIFLVWLGQNFFNISIYAADARAQRLPLLGGGRVYHDWHFILGEFGLLDYDKMFGNIFVFLGFVAFTVALFIPLLIKSHKKENTNPYA